MKISTEQLSQVLKVYNQDKKSDSTIKGKDKSKSDKLSLSSGAQELQLAKQSLEQGDSVRQEKVAKLKQQIKSGNYNVSGEQVASKMLSQAVVDNLV
ncbi:MAG: flagellar biosynthesis anti-sigma factor FlgM [Bacillota bacterium]